MEFLEHKMILTRLGEHANSKIIICGDQRQSDLHKGKDTLTQIYNIIKDSPYVSSVVFDKNDIVRSAAVKDILGRIEDYEDQNERK
jgi:phosphate starvation-inducible protein PhoH